MKAKLPRPRRCGIDLGHPCHHGLLDVLAVTRTAQPFVRLGLGHDLRGGLRFSADLRVKAKNADLSVGIGTRC